MAEQKTGDPGVQHPRSTDCGFQCEAGCILCCLGFTSETATKNFRVKKNMKTLQKNLTPETIKFFLGLLEPCGQTLEDGVDHSFVWNIVCSIMQYIGDMMCNTRTAPFSLENDGSFDTNGKTGEILAIPSRSRTWCRVTINDTNCFQVCNIDICKNDQQLLTSAAATALHGRFWKGVVLMSVTTNDDDFIVTLMSPLTKLGGWQLSSILMRGYRWVISHDVETLTFMKITDVVAPAKTNSAGGVAVYTNVSSNEQPESWNPRVVSTRTNINVIVIAHRMGRLTLC